MLLGGNAEARTAYALSRMENGSEKGRTQWEVVRVLYDSISEVVNPHGETLRALLARSIHLAM